MTSEELYEKLEKAGLEFEIVEMFEGVRLLEFLIDEGDE